MNRLAYSIFSVLVVAVASTATIGYASGYRYNFNTHKIFKVGAIRFISEPASKISINGTVFPKESPRVIYLEPGFYKISLKSLGYHPYERAFYLNSGELIEDRNIVLFKETSKPTLISENNNNTTKFIDSSLVNNNNLFVAYGHEIWRNNDFVTRFSEVIYNLIPYDDNYILYQSESGIYCVKNDGSNNYKLVDITSQSAMSLNLKERGHTLEILDNKKIYQADIQ